MACAQVECVRFEALADEGELLLQGWVKHYWQFLLFLGDYFGKKLYCFNLVFVFIIVLFTLCCLFLQLHLRQIVFNNKRNVLFSIIIILCVLIQLLPRNKYYILPINNVLLAFPIFPPIHHRLISLISHQLLNYLINCVTIGQWHKVQLLHNLCNRFLCLLWFVHWRR